VTVCYFIRMRSRRRAELSAPGKRHPIPMMAIGILSALNARTVTQTGQHVRTSMLQSTLGFLVEPIAYRGPYEYSVPGSVKDFTPQFEPERA